MSFTESIEPSGTGTPAPDHRAAARSAFESHDYAEVIQHCFSVFTEHPVDLEMHMLNFQAMVRCGLHSSSLFSEAVLDTMGNDRWGIIENNARASLAENPKDEGAANILSRVTYFISAASDKAALIDQLKTINPRSPIPLLLMAWEAGTSHQNAEESNRLLEAAVSQAEGDAELLVWAADLYVILEPVRNLHRALALYNDAHGLNPQLTYTYLGRVGAYQELGAFAAAHADLDTATQLTPFDYRIYNFRAGLFKAQGNNAAALTEYKRALAINPASYSALKGLIELATRLDNLEDRRAAAMAFLYGHVMRPVEAMLSPATPVHIRLSGMDVCVVRSLVTEGMQKIFVVEPTESEISFPAALLVAPDGGAVAFVSRAIGHDPVLRIALTASIAGIYTLLVVMNGTGEREFIVRME